MKLNTLLVTEFWLTGSALVWRSVWGVWPCITSKRKPFFCLVCLFISKKTILLGNGEGIYPGKQGGFSFRCSVLKWKEKKTIFLTDNWFELTVVTQCKQSSVCFRVLSCGRCRRACELRKNVANTVSNKHTLTHCYHKTLPRQWM